MQKKVSFLFGVTLILLGLLALAGNLLVKAFGSNVNLGFHAWPIFVVGVGLLFCIPPFLYRENRGLSGLLIPGLPILTSGMILFFASISTKWGIWSALWPLEIISVSVAFVLMGIFMKIPWLMIPASIIGFTGVLLQFCASTGLWNSWAVLWTVEPFSVGLPLLVIGVMKKIQGLKLAGIIVTGFSIIAFAAMSSLVNTSNWLIGVIGPVLILGLGVFLLFSALRKKKNDPAIPPQP